jgi:hypothetical protein
MLHAHLEEKAGADCTGAAAGGTFSAGSGGSGGIREWMRPELEFFPDDRGTEGPVLPDGFFPVSLYLSDVVNRRRAAAARAPHVKSIRRANDDLMVLRFQSEPGAIYQLWTILDLRSNKRRLLTEFEAGEESTEVELPIRRGVPHEFFEVSDLSE